MAHLSSGMLLIQAGPQNPPDLHMQPCFDRPLPSRALRQPAQHGEDAAPGACFAVYKEHGRRPHRFGLLSSGPSGPPGPDRYGDRQGPYDRRGPPPGGPGGYGRRYPDEWHPDDRYAAPDDRYGPPDDRYGGAADDRYGGRGARSPPRSRCTLLVP